MSPWPYPNLFAHRGGGLLAPENTLAAMRVGRESGYQAVEFDVKLSADGVAILMHDAVLGRTSTGSGAVGDLRYDELAKLDAGSWHSADFAGEGIPRLTEVAHWLITNGMVVNVEIKPCPGRDVETGHLVGALCRDLWLGQAVQPLVSSFSHAALVAARRAAPDLKLGLLVKEFETRHFVTLEQLNCVSLHCHHGAISDSMIEALHARCYRIMVYTVNEVELAEALLAMGVDGIFTDRLPELRAAFPGMTVVAGT